MIEGVLIIIFFMAAFGLFAYNLKLSGDLESAERQLESAKQDIEFYKELASVFEDKYHKSDNRFELLTQFIKKCL